MMGQQHEDLRKQQQHPQHPHKQLSVVTRRVLTLCAILMGSVVWTSWQGTLLLTNHQQHQQILYGGGAGDEDGTTLPLPNTIQGPHGPLQRLNPKSQFLSNAAAVGASRQDPQRFVHPRDFIYRRPTDTWDSAPIVLEEYKLVFFSVPHIACTRFKQLMRRMQGLEDWKNETYDTHFLPHNMKFNGLSYLWDYNRADASERMTSPDWTRAVFVKDPKERFSSLYYDKAAGISPQQGESQDNPMPFLVSHCCPDDPSSCLTLANGGPAGFLEVLQNCSDPHWDPLYYRMEAKYWKYVNFVGSADHLYEDTKRLLTKLKAWDAFGAQGWGTLNQQPAGDISTTSGSVISAGSKEDALFGTHHMVDQSIWQVPEWNTPALEKAVEDYYVMDYEMPLFSFPKERNATLVASRTMHVGPQDSVYQRGAWDGAPVVLEEFKLIFFTIPKAADQTWKMLFRRMQGLDDWDELGGPNMLPHNPEFNGLKYLYHYDRHTASHMMESEEWTKAVFLQHPKDRFLAVYSDMMGNPQFVENACCPEDPGCGKSTKRMERFLGLIQDCPSAHWSAQSNRMEDKFWKDINFVGHVANLEIEGMELLKQVGAWDPFGKTGWGVDGTESIFAHDDGQEAVNSVMTQYTPEIDRLLETVYKEDFTRKQFGFKRQLATIRKQSSRRVRNG